MMSKRQLWARKRNWLLLRLKGARSIFSGDNIAFMFRELIKEGNKKKYVYDCPEALDNLIDVIDKSVYEPERDANLFK